MARFRKVDIRMWGDLRVRNLSPPQPNAQTLWLDLLVGRRTTNIPGVIDATLGVLADDRGWHRDAIEDAIRDVIANGLAMVDREGGIIWLPGAPKQEINRPNGPNTVKSWGRVFSELNECHLKGVILEDLRKWITSLGKSYDNAFRDAFPDAIPDAIADGVSMASRCHPGSSNSNSNKAVTETPLPSVGVQARARDIGQGVDNSVQGEGLSRSLAMAPEPVVRPEAEMAGAVARVWREQERLRRELGLPGLVLGGRERMAVEDRLRDRVAAHTEAEADDPLRMAESDCLHVLSVRAAECRSDPEQVRWMNGRSNWNEKTFSAALGRLAVVEDKPRRMSALDIKSILEGGNCEELRDVIDID